MVIVATAGRIVRRTVMVSAAMSAGIARWMIKGLKNDVLMKHDFRSYVSFQHLSPLF